MLKTVNTQEPDAPFWRTVPLAEMSPQQWESLCDGCGRCCLNKIIFEYEEEGTEELGFTNVACRMLDGDTCQCKDYPNRRDHVPDCVSLTAAMVPELDWLPPTCGYRLIHEGRDLYWWHPLVSGSPETVHAAGISVRGKTVSEENVTMDDWEFHVVDWPGEEPPLMTEAEIRAALEAAGNKAVG